MQRRLKLAYEVATCSIKVPGTVVVPIRLAEALGGKNSHDYEMRVEPSMQGGKKMAQLIMRRLGITDGASQDAPRE